MAADILVRCLHCGWETPCHRDPLVDRIKLYCSECGEVTPQRIIGIGEQEWRADKSIKPRAYYEEAAPIEEHIWRRLEKARPSDALRFFESLEPVDKPNK
jgi:hypothetical protein